VSNESILIVEDDAAIVDVLNAYLNREGFVGHALSRGDAVLPWLAAHHADLLLLDVMLPGLDGLEICKQIRRTSQIPIILMSARVEEIDRLIGLEIGADDYICKPFSPREVMARIRAVLRRAKFAMSPPTQFKEIDIDRDSFSVRILGQPLELTPKEFKILDTLNNRRGSVFSRNQLLDAIHSKDEVVDRSIDNHIKNLRRKIAKIIGEQEVICSIYGMGYRLEIGDLSGDD